MSAEGTSTVHLHCTPSAALADPAIRDTVIASAHGIAERTGVVLRSVETEDSSGLRITVEGPDVIAPGLVAELRRHTDRWHRGRTGHPLWPGPEPGDHP